MAQKRMFSLKVIDTDIFTDMPVSAQALYFHLGMHGDDDGFVSSPKKISRAVGCNDSDIQLLVERGFIIPFANGVVVITDWKINNTIKADRYTETIYLKEKSLLQLENNGRYRLGPELDPIRFQCGSKMETQFSEEEDKSSLVIGGALSADCLKSTVGMDAPASKQQEEMNFNDLREQQIKRLRDYQV